MNGAVRSKLVLWYVLAIGSIGALHPFLALALGRAGASATSAALLMILFPLGFLASGPLWGWIADRTGRPDGVLRVAAGICAVAVVAAAATPDWRFLVPSLALLALCRAPLMPLVDVLTVQSLGTVPEAYGRVRLWGSVAFIGAVYAVGAMVEEHWRAPLVATAVLLGGACLLTFWLPALPRPEEANLRPRIGPLLGHETLVPLGIVAVLHGVTSGGHDYYFAVHVDGLGLPPSVASAGFMLGVGAEVAVMAASPFLLARFGSRALVLIGVGAGIPRYLITAMATTPAVLAVTQLLHGFSFGAWWIGVIALLAEEAPKELRNSAQSLLMATNFGLGPLLALGVAAVVVERFGTVPLYGTTAALSVLATALVLRTLRR